MDDHAGRAALKLRLGNRERRSATKTSAGDLAGIHIPSVVIHGSADRILPVEAVLSESGN
jgi:pimeloyl-ACP methyl ester carboxylesterase